MDKPATTAERPVSKPKQQIIREAQRIEESLLYSSKGHFAASHLWSTFHLWIGIPMVILSGVAGASALSKFDAGGTVAGILSRSGLDFESGPPRRPLTARGDA